jgi:hypothetical protein
LVWSGLFEEPCFVFVFGVVSVPFVCFPLRGSYQPRNPSDLSCVHFKPLKIMRLT